MFLFTNFFSVFIPFWGMIGFWTNRIGYHHRVSIYSVTSYNRSQLTSQSVGILFLQCHIRFIPSALLRRMLRLANLSLKSLFSFWQIKTQYAQTMISELMPQGYDNMFFALFGVTNRAVSFFFFSFLFSHAPASSYQYSVFIPHHIPCSPLTSFSSLPSSALMWSKPSLITPRTTGWGFRSWLPSVQPLWSSSALWMSKRGEKTAASL